MPCGSRFKEGVFEYLGGQNVANTQMKKFGSSNK